jgi:hypothetical protein
MFVLRKLESLTPQLPPRLPNVRNRPSSTTEVCSFEEINEVMNSSPIQHYISSLHGSVNAGEAVLLDEEFLLPKVATIIRKQESPSGFIVNFYVFPRPNDIEVPRLPIPWLEENLRWLSSPGGYPDPIRVCGFGSQI